MRSRRMRCSPLRKSTSPPLARSLPSRGSQKASLQGRDEGDSFLAHNKKSPPNAGGDFYVKLVKLNPKGWDNAVGGVCNVAVANVTA